LEHRSPTYSADTSRAKLASSGTLVSIDLRRLLHISPAQVPSPGARKSYDAAHSRIGQQQKPDMVDSIEEDESKTGRAGPAPVAVYGEGGPPLSGPDG
jgi:hypothetical protein